jgi:hypothetical protein
MQQKYTGCKNDEMRLFKLPNTPKRKETWLKRLKFFFKNSNAELMDENCQPGVLQQGKAVRCPSSAVQIAVRRPFAEINSTPGMPQRILPKPMDIG